jgi:hypothetical protein
MPEDNFGLIYAGSKRQRNAKITAGHTCFIPLSKLTYENLRRN